MAANCLLDRCFVSLKLFPAKVIWESDNKYLYRRQKKSLANKKQYQTATCAMTSSDLVSFPRKKNKLFGFSHFEWENQPTKV